MKSLDDMPAPLLKKVAILFAKSGENLGDYFEASSSDDRQTPVVFDDCWLNKDELKKFCGLSVDTIRRAAALPDSQIVISKVDPSKKNSRTLFLRSSINQFLMSRKQKSDSNEP